ncbi:MAG TPA: ABC transporter permease [Gemmatimonadaceae bacterium]|nr:ABC transporter permease [Gemmatimonadaceae bacterium]
MTDVSPFLEAAVRTATPLLIAAAGESISERAGVINIGLEGCIIAGAYAAFATGGIPIAGYTSAIFAGLAVGITMAFFAVVMRRDQIIVGAGLTMLALGLTGTLFRLREASAPLVTTEPVTAIPLLSRIPVVGPALFAQPAITYFAFALVPALWWWSQRTQGGLALRAVGDSPSAAKAAGVQVVAVQAGAVIVGSALGGLAGGSLVLAQAGTFAEGMSAGRGFLAIAIVALGRWQPVGVALASLIFGAAMALQYVVQAMGWGIRYELVLMIPYVLTLVALAARRRGVSQGQHFSYAPAMLGRSLPDD